MNDDQVLEKLSETDLYAADTLMPVSAWSRETALSEIERRTGMDTRDTTNRKETPPGVTEEIKSSSRPGAVERLKKETGRRRWSGALVGAAAFAVVVIVGVAILLASRGGGEVAPATTQAATTTLAPPTTLARPTVDEALAVKDAYIAAANAGDADAVLALFEPDPTIDHGNGIVARDLVSFERYLVWSIAQGTTVTAENCTATELEDTVHLSCRATRHQHLFVAVGAPAPEGTLALTVSADGIRSFLEGYSVADFAVANRPFDRWLFENHPEEFAARPTFGRWDSVAQAEEAGTLRGQRADEWAAYLEENGCTYQDTTGC